VIGCIHMVNMWDYDINELKKTEKGRIFILERMINYGPGKEKIKLSLVKKYWNEINLYQSQRRLFELILWGKYQSSPKNKKMFWMS